MVSTLSLCSRSTSVLAFIYSLIFSFIHSWQITEYLNSYGSYSGTWCKLEISILFIFINSWVLSKHFILVSWGHQTRVTNTAWIRHQSITGLRAYAHLRIHSYLDTIKSAASAANKWYVVEKLENIVEHVRNVYGCWKNMQNNAQTAT